MTGEDYNVEEVDDGPEQEGLGVGPRRDRVHAEDGQLLVALERAVVARRQAGAAGEADVEHGRRDLRVALQHLRHGRETWITGPPFRARRPC